MNEHRWTAISDSNFVWEREALEWLRTRLPNRDPWQAWSNFEFIDEEGKVNEVDTLILSPMGLFLVEVKSRPGTVSGDAHTWTWQTDGRRHAYDNPLILANRKAKRLASLLRRQTAVIKAKIRVPFIEPLIFLSAVAPENCKLAGHARSGVCLKGTPDADRDDGIVARLSGTAGTESQRPVLGHDLVRVLCRAIVEAGIRPSNKHRQVGDYQLVRCLSEGDNHQDWEGRHISAGVLRRVRIYGYASAATPEARKSLVRQATREFQILEGIEHPGILRVRDFKESELGPALLFDYEPQSRRLDFLLKEHGARMNVDQRLSILRQLAETLKYAHQKKLYHRALSPHSILVRDPAEAQLKLQIMNWQLAARDGGTLNTQVRTAGTQHVSAYVEDPASIFMAPEAFWGTPGAGPHLDIFSLGAIAFEVFTGQTPAANRAELQDRLRAGDGLLISDGMDGAGKELQDLVQLSTRPDVARRFGSMDEFLQSLDYVEDELTAPPVEATVDPAVAKTNERLDGGFTVVRRLGKGSCSDVLLVRRDDSEAEWVLKVALDASHNDRLLAEGEVLSKLRHPNIVEWLETLKVAGRVALLMKSAGKDSLAHLLKKQEARPSLDLIRRFGDELLQLAVFLEDQGIHHRDIKPDNIGITESHGGKKRLVLYDFSLSRTPIDNIHAGTRPYLDPFLPLRKPTRWDLYAERFAVAMTLYEMVTGLLPTWGDGQSDPALLEDEATLDIGLFDPNLREGLTAFFAKALRRDFRERHDNAEDMLRDWRAVFDRAEASPVQADSFERIAQTAHRETAIGELGYSTEALNVLERMGIHNIRELLAVDRVRFRYLKSVGDKIRKEIRLKAKQLAQLRPDLMPVPGLSETDQSPRGRSIDELADQLLPRRAVGDERPEEAALAFYLGLESDDTDSLWPTLGMAATSAGVGRAALTTTLVTARSRWLKSKVFTEVREELATALTSAGGILTAHEAASLLLASRGSIQRDDEQRLRLSASVLRAVVEAESELAGLRYQFFPGQPTPLIAATVDHADYAIRLGQAADALATTDDRSSSLPTAQQAVETLEAVDRPFGVAPLSSQRLLKLAAACSGQAAISSRLELYPRGMPAQRAIRLALGSLIGPSVLTESQVKDRILGRYPEAEALPSRPALDNLLTDAGADLVFRPEGEQGPGYYPARRFFKPTAGTSTFFGRYSTPSGSPDLPEELADVRQFEDRLAYSAKQGGFLALVVPPRLSRHAESGLLERFGASLGFHRLSLDRVILETLREEAKKLRVAWGKVLEADENGPGVRDWNNLMRLVARGRPHIQARLLAEKRPLLLVNPGLLARLGLMDIVTELQNATSRADGLPVVWLLVPSPSQGLPTLDGAPIPVISSAQWAKVPETWISQCHRAAA